MCNLSPYIKIYLRATDNSFALQEVITRHVFFFFHLRRLNVSIKNNIFPADLEELFNINDKSKLSIEEEIYKDHNVLDQDLMYFVHLRMLQRFPTLRFIYGGLFDRTVEKLHTQRS